jgi:hypothetical protein
MTDEELMEALASIKAAILLADKNQKDVNDQAWPRRIRTSSRRFRASSLAGRLRSSATKRKSSARPSCKAPAK